MTMTRPQWRVACAIGIVLALAGVALARPGGGQSYSGGGGHSGGSSGGHSGGSSGGGSGGSGGGQAVFELVYWLLRLAIYYPQVGLPVIGTVIGFVIYSAYKQHKNKDWDSGPPLRTQALGQPRRGAPHRS